MAERCWIQSEQVINRPFERECRWFRLFFFDFQLFYFAYLAFSNKINFNIYLNCQTHAYVTYQDIRSIKSLDKQTVIAIKAPPETRLEVPDPTQSIQIWLKSNKGPIEVYLCPEEAGGEHSDSHGTGCSSSEEESRSSFSTSEDSRSNDDFKCKLTKLRVSKPFFLWLA